MTRSLASAMCVVAAGVVLGAQTPPAPQQQAPVFRAGTTVVPLTVTVLDQKGVPVKDLKQSDFTVYENRREREIVNFFPQAFGPGPVTPVPKAAERGRDAGVAPQTRRMFLIVLATGPYQNVFHSLDGLITFVRERLLPQDAIALMAFHRVTPLTTDHEGIARILEQYKARHRRLTDDLWLNIVRTTPSLFGKKIDDATVLAGQARIFAEIDTLLGGVGPLRNISDFLYAMDAAAVVDKPESTTVPLGTQARTDAQPGARRETFADVVNGLDGRDLTTLAASSNRFKLVAGVEFLHYLEGDKHLIFLTSTGLARDADDVKIVARRATDARVVVHMIGNTGFDWASRDVVNLTGGFYSSLEYSVKALAKIDEQTRFSYLLGYTPVNPNLDGTYRDVNVKVNRPGVTVRFEHGYYAVAEPDPLDVKDFIFKSRLEAALAYTSNKTDIGVKVTARMLPKIGIQAEAGVEITIAAANLNFAQKDGIRTDQIELQVYCGDAREQIVCDFGERLELTAGEEVYADWLRDGIRRSVRVPVTATPKFVKVVVFDYGSEKIGTFMFTIK